MRVIGIDPGSRITGYGVIKFDGGEMVALDYGHVKPPPSYPLSKRFTIIYDALEKIIQRFAPEHMAIESPFFCKNVSSAFKLSEVRGVILLAGSKAGLEIYEYSPRKVKQAVVGRGAAAKRQIGTMVSQILAIEQDALSEDSSDALAVAICHVHSLASILWCGKKT